MLTIIVIVAIVVIVVVLGKDIYDRRTINKNIRW
jgi:hypothetical protein